MNNLSLPSWCDQVVVFDTETTGVDVHEARIVTASIALLNVNNKVITRHDWFINPEIEIPDQASRVHGITTEMAIKNGMNAKTAVTEIINCLTEYAQENYAIVIYNAPYDLDVLYAEASRHKITPLTQNINIIDPLIIDKQLDKYRKGKRTLIASCEHYNITLDNAHDAGSDAIAAGNLFFAIAEKYQDSIPQSAQELHTQQITWACEQAESFAAWMRQNRDPNFIANTKWPLRIA